MDENELDFTKLKYVLYARKSTTDETRQVRSIPDQIHDCELLANRIGMLIDMVDTGVIKDLKFVTHTYSPEAVP